MRRVLKRPLQIFRGKLRGDIITNSLSSLPRITLDNILKIADGYQDLQLMHAALECDIFTQLSDVPETAKGISEKSGTDLFITEKLLNALVSIDLLFKSDGKYHNTELSDIYLSRRSPYYQGNYIKTQKLVSFGTNSYGDWDQIGKALEKGYLPPSKEGFELYDKIFSLSMKEMAIRGEAQGTAEVLSNYPWFKDAKRVIDVGGTHGLYSIALLAKNPQLEATLFDIPGVPELGDAPEHFKQYNVSDRIQIRTGNFFMRTDIGSGYDIAFISNVYFLGTADALLDNIFDSLNSGGRFVLKNSVIRKDRTGPFISSLLDLDMCFWGENHHLFSIDECIDLIEPHGFEIENVSMLEGCCLGSIAILVFKKVD